MHLAAPEVEIQPVDRAHAAKVQADAGQDERRAVAIVRCQRAQGGKIGRDLPSCGERVARGEVEQVGDPARNREHDHQQQRRIEERRPGYERGGELGSTVSRMVPSSGPRMEPRPPISMAMKNRTERSKVNASGVM